MERYRRRELLSISTNMSNSLIREKLSQTIKLLQEFDVDCWLMFTRESGINGDPMLPYFVPDDLTWHSAILLYKSGRKVVIVGDYERPTLEKLGMYDEVIGHVTGIDEILKTELRNQAPQNIAINYSVTSEICDGLTHGMFLTLEKILDDTGFSGELISAENLAGALRERKTEEELRRIQEAANYTEEIWQALRHFIQIGQTEKEIAHFVHREIEIRGLETGWTKAHCPAVFAGIGDSEAHTGPTDRRVQAGQIVNMDFGVRYEDYVSDTQRVFYVLEPGESTAPVEVSRAFEVLTTAIDEARIAMQSGVPATNIDALVRTYMRDQGYEEYAHGLGHQVGRFVHDGFALMGPPWPKYGEKVNRLLEENMVFTIEPRMIIPNRGIMSIEEMVVVRRDGAEWMTNPQKEIFII